MTEREYHGTGRLCSALGRMAGVLGLAVQVGSSLVTDLLLETLGPKKRLCYRLG